MYHHFKWTRSSLGRNELTRQYEPLQPHLLMTLADRFECDMFVDVGSNVGAYALLMSTVPSIRSIHAFEPSPDTFAELRANVSLNNANVQIYNQAVSDRPGVLSFGIVNSLSGANSVIDTSLHDSFVQTIEVNAVCLDDILPDENRRICMKIDIEGHEPAALTGMKKLLSSNDIVLQIEDYSDDTDEILKLLQPFGFKSLFRIGSDRYFSNIAPLLTPEEVIAVFESGAERLVKTNLAALEEVYSKGPAPLRIPLSKSLNIEIGGPLASFARKARQKMLGRVA